MTVSTAYFDDDTTIRFMSAGSNYWYGVTDGEHWTGWETKTSQTQILYRCDFSAEVQAGDDVDAATLYLYVAGVTSSGLAPEDWNWDCIRIRRNGQNAATEWIEDEATDEDYCTDTAWGADGAEDTTTDRDAGLYVYTVGPADVPCWWTFDVTTLVQDARANHNDVFDVIIDPGFTPIGENDYLYLRIPDALNETTPPYLSITHSAAAPPTFVPRVMIF